MKAGSGFARNFTDSPAEEWEAYARQLDLDRFGRELREVFIEQAGRLGVTLHGAILVRKRASFYVDVAGDPLRRLRVEVTTV